MNGRRMLVAVTAGAALYGGVVAVPAAADGGRRHVSVWVDDMGQRPGGLLQVTADGLGRLRARQKVIASSPAFARPVRLTEYSTGVPGDHSLLAKAAIAMSARPGRYPVRITLDGRTVARSTVQVVPAKRPEFSVSQTPGWPERPGEQLGVSYDDLYPGETGHAFTVRSAAFDKPVALTHDADGPDWNNPRLFDALPMVSRRAKDGVYTVTLHGPSGRVLARKRITVRAARPGDHDYRGNARGPFFFGLSGSAEEAKNRYRTQPGGTFNVLWKDTFPDGGEETTLTATSPAFQRPVRLERDDSKAADGDDPRYYAPARIRPDLAPGSYPVTVVSHHGRVKRTSQIVVTGTGTGATTGSGTGRSTGTESTSGTKSTTGTGTKSPTEPNSTTGNKSTASTASTTGAKRTAAAPDENDPGHPAVLAGAGAGVAAAAGAGFVLWRRRMAR
ncbi:hypothetical protein [Streptomyces sp. MST-110588]|uniref:hypothetical protein n=1 Tax=Streptomyces sp. MST-110588 TaxID=2833628 RepID=UPI001F5E27F1|nr:hypothetical protein [Streptomyces sp. MST-110588]UNO39824.1 hypothetical protein KGS77_09760 [Streptomyces sp. MST-110588]